MKALDYQLEFASDSSILVGTSAAGVRVLFEALRKRSDLSEVIENLHPAYQSLLIDFDPAKIQARVFLAEIYELTKGLKTEQAPSGRLIEIPVHYGGTLGPDLEFLAKHTGMTEKEVIERHCSANYRVAFLGFAPGFPYLEGLPEELICPRLATPRIRVPAGSVAIGGAQTGIYPEALPGGWRIIGQTALRLFDPSLAESAAGPTLLLPGDRVKFQPQQSEA